jgi:uncharacterized protein YecT (DUF1311 family)
MPSLYARFRSLAITFALAFAAIFLIASGALRSNAAGTEIRKGQEGSGPLRPSPPSQTPEPQAQETPPATPPPQEPQAELPRYDKAIFQPPIPSDQLAFLKNFDGSPSGDVIKDKQYRKLIHSVIPDCMFHYGSDMSIPDALDLVIKGSPQLVQIRDGRYMMVSGRNGPYLAGRGFMWIDMQDGIALGGFYFHPTNGEPTPTVNIFSKQVKLPFIEMSQLPPAFAQDLAQWSAEFNVPTVTTRYFITGSNIKILLEHDEDYCEPTDGTNAQGDCEQMNADASDIDMNAAYYLEQVNHATNATAWMITGQDEVLWIHVRDNTCGTLLDPLGCHVRMTRQHTHEIIHQHPVPHPPPHPPSSPPHH